MPLQKKIASLMLIAVVGASALFAADLTKDEQSWVAKASRETRNGWVYLHIEGQPFARGFQHGYLLAKEIAESLRVEKHMTWWDTGTGVALFRRTDPEDVRPEDRPRIPRGNGGDRRRRPQGRSRRRATGTSSSSTHRPRSWATGIPLTRKTVRR